MSDPVLSARRLSKVYGSSGLATLLGLHAAPGRHASLEPLDIELERGVSLGLVGANGAGKTTLLRLLLRLIQPTTGEVNHQGLVRGLVELGTGFLPELSGSENIRLARAISLSRRDEQAFEKRVRDFSELDRAALERPVRTYSDGMRLRLAYALAIADDPDVLVVDEVLAVGDEAFQRRCSLHLEEFLGAGGALVLASHNLYQVEKLCRDAIWLAHGQVASRGPSSEVARHYREASARDGDSADAASRGSARVMQIRAGGGEEGDGGSYGHDLRFVLEDLAVDVVEITTTDGALVASLRSPGGSRGSIHVRSGALLPGTYLARARRGREIVAEGAFECAGGRRELGCVHLRHEWR